MTQTVVVKISGESLRGEQYALSHLAFTRFVSQIRRLVDFGIKCVVVLGAGNIFRGRDSATMSINSDDGDQAAMLATGVNALVFAARCKSVGLRSVVLTSGPCVSFGIPWTQRSLAEALATNDAVVLAGGLGIGGISSDVSAVQLAADAGVGCLVLAKHEVDGVYTSDPRRSPNAKLIEEISATEAYRRQLSFTDPEALLLAGELHIKLHVVNAQTESSIFRAAKGERVGSVIRPE
ncbi:hypothetical protein [Kribbella sp. CA-294648]|uniref:amino acid kinase family protein n=1 Tax=Kribbella sp. CA-294648 TaxID=3239948 RepID=UPI003D8C720A